MNTTKTSSLHECTRVISHGYDRFDKKKFRDVFNTFYSAHNIQRAKLKILYLSSRKGSWSYSFKVRCSEVVCNDLKTEFNKALEDMGIPFITY